MTYTLGDMGALGYIEDDEWLEEYFRAALFDPYQEELAREEGEDYDPFKSYGHGRG